MDPQIPSGAVPPQTFQSQRPPVGGTESGGVIQPYPETGVSPQNSVTPEPQGSNTRSTNGWKLRLPKLFDSHDRMTQSPSQPPAPARLANSRVVANQAPATIRTSYAAPAANGAQAAVELLDADGWRPARTTAE
jgi:hypothetical protein